MAAYAAAAAEAAMVARWAIPAQVLGAPVPARCSGGWAGGGPSRKRYAQRNRR